MAEEDKDSKQLPATQKRLKKAASEGQVVRSRDLGHAATIGAAVLGFKFLGDSIGTGLLEVLRSGMTFSPIHLLDPSWMGRRLGSLAVSGLSLTAPMMVLLALILAASASAPGGPILTPKPLTPNFSKLDPISGFGRIFSKDALVNLLKLMVVSVLLGAVSWLLLSNGFAGFAHLAELPLGAGVGIGLDRLLNYLSALMGVLLLVALIDVPWQIFRHAERLKMSHQDVREEHKESEGDPHVKAKIRQRQREMGRIRMLAAVPTADVVITNPTHYAVAIRYDEGRMAAPRVIAKGADHMALTIRSIAVKHGVTIVELPPLARALYAHVKVDREIPEALYSAVAQVLAYVYQLRHFIPGLSARRPEAPSVVDIPAELDPDLPTGAAR